MQSEFTIIVIYYYIESGIQERVLYIVISENKKYKSKKTFKRRQR